MATIILLGPPGAGKGTQTENIIQHYPLVPILPGFLSREHIRKGTEIGKKLENYVNEGLLAPQDIILNLVEESIKQAPPGSQLLFDGFPRSIDQVIPLEQMLLLYGYQIDGVILFEAPIDILKERIRHRALVLGRADDQAEEKVNRRLEIYQHEIQRVKHYYDERSKLYRVHAVGSIPEVFGRVKEAVETINEKALALKKT
jgi:adenylate kinase